MSEHLEPHGQDCYKRHIECAAARYESSQEALKEVMGELRGAAEDRDALQAQVAGLTEERNFWRLTAKLYGQNVCDIFEIGKGKLDRAEARAEALARRVAGLEGALNRIAGTVKEKPDVTLVDESNGEDWRDYGVELGWYWAGELARQALADRPGGEAERELAWVGTISSNDLVLSLSSRECEMPGTCEPGGIPACHPCMARDIVASRADGRVGEGEEEK